MSTKDVPPNRHVHPSTPRWVRWSLFLNAISLAALIQVAMRSPFSFPARPSPSPQPAFHECRAPLPPFLATKVPFGTEPPLQEAFGQLDSVLQRYFDQGGIDSLSVAVVGSEGSLYEGFWGTRRANESDVGEDTTVDRHSIYRLASISKLFTALETLILRDRGVLKL
jgi:CubicO group peptidase (beta-lactamase class C family)